MVLGALVSLASATHGSEQSREERECSSPRPIAAGTGAVGSFDFPLALKSPSSKVRRAVIVYRKGEGVEADEPQSFLQDTAEIVGKLEAGTAKLGAAL
jgi:hypothetical protein